MMSNSTRTALLILAGAFFLGVLGDNLLPPFPLGLNVWLWVTALVAVAWAVGRKVGPGLTGPGRYLLAGAVLFAGGLLWRASPVLQLFDLLAVVISLGLAALTTRGGSLSRTGVLSYPLGLAVSVAHHLFGPFQLLFADVAWNELPRGRWSYPLAAVVRGLLIALPLLFLFGLLFIAADAVFEHLILDLFAIDLEDLFGHLFGTLFFGFLAAGFLRTALLKQPGELPRIERPATMALGAIELGVILGLLNLLFLAFVIIQVRYLFGGAELVMATVNLTYAEYARRGFFELVKVAALVLPVLLALHWLIPAEQAIGQRLFRWMGGSLVAMLFVIMASAVQRMLLYQQEYGLTELRLYTTAFMGWMALLFGWFLVTVLRNQRERFALGALVSGLLVLALLHLINPDALIIRTNLAHLDRTGRFDAAYATSLGPDALPILAAAIPEIPAQDRPMVTSQLLERRERLGQAGWRGWNWGRAQALLAISRLSLQETTGLEQEFLTSTP